MPWQRLACDPSCSGLVLPRHDTSPPHHTRAPPHAALTWSLLPHRCVAKYASAPIFRLLLQAQGGHKVGGGGQCVNVCVCVRACVPFGGWCASRSADLMPRRSLALLLERFRCLRVLDLGAARGLALPPNTAPTLIRGDRAQPQGFERGGGSSEGIEKESRWRGLEGADRAERAGEEAGSQVLGCLPHLLHLCLSFCQDLTPDALFALLLAAPGEPAAAPCLCLAPPAADASCLLPPACCLHPSLETGRRRRRSTPLACWLAGSSNFASSRQACKSCTST